MKENKKMSTINEKIEKLLEENRQYFEGKPIAFDGIVDEDTYKISKIKTVFLLKEVNDPDMNKDWTEFMYFVKQQAEVDSMYKTWPNVCLWIEALNNPDADYLDCVDQYGNFATKKLQKNILEVAIVNIKKTAGGGSSNYEEIFEAATKYGHIIEKEIEELILPQLVICGGTFDYAKMIFKVCGDEIKTFPSGAQFFFKNNILYLQFVHPMWFSVNRNILFAYAKNVFKDVRKLLDEDE